jgi:hypothetical protein
VPPEKAHDVRLAVAGGPRPGPNRQTNVDYTFAGRGPALSIVLIIIVVIVVLALLGFLGRGRLGR